VATTFIDEFCVRLGLEGGDGGQSVPLIVGVAAGVGGFLILTAIIVTAVVVICAIFRKRRRSV